MTQALCESGIKAVAIFDIQPTLGEAMAEALYTSTGIPVKYYNVDLVDEDGVDSAVDQVVQEFGDIDILINSAGVAFSNIKAEAYKIDDFKKTININLIGSFRIAQAVGRHMIAATPTVQQQGTSAISTSSNPFLPDRSIILIASMSGSIVNYPQPQCAYNASKAAVIQLSKSLGAEWARYGIRVNTVSPGYMDTALNSVSALDRQKKIWKERTPMGRLGGVEELNGLVLWLAGEGSRFCTGSDLRVDGGYSIW
jgi:NAD(P)-dependent dehydrogenase (short-subunit alcohol dehydrogenase family)